MAKAVNGSGDRAILRSDGRWMCRWRDMDGKRQTVYGKSAAEAEAKKRAGLALRDGGMAAPKPVGKMTVATLLDEYLAYVAERVKAGERGHATWSQYEKRIRLYLKPMFGRKALRQLTRDDVRTGFKMLKLAKSSRKGTFTILKAALTLAQAEGYRLDNPCQFISMPKGDSIGRAMRMDQIQLVLEAIRGEHDEVLWLIAILSGLRPGELAGLRWMDVALEEGAVWVRTAISRVSKAAREALEIPDPLLRSKTKTEKGRRQVLLDPLAVGMLRVQGDACGMEPEAQVFSNSRGAFLTEQALHRRWHQIQTRAGIVEHFRPYDCRHTANTLQRKVDRSGRISRDRMGHTTEEINRTYQHPDVEEQQPVVEHIHRLLFAESTLKAA